ncbi:MAG: hypothetical protein JWO03_121 [Bacteroidetes bacterium]|nr:hypothetical protein [Bacteroidota bacterium]
MYRLSLVILLILASAVPLVLSAQIKDPSNVNTDIYIPLRSREEVKIQPLPDTLSCDKEYLLRLHFSSKYKFSELFFDKGLATRIDSFLSIRPRTSKTTGVDTATLRIIGFSNNNRILLYHKFTIVAQSKSFPTINPNKSSNITVGNMALERDMSYDKGSFPEKCTFGYLDNGRFIRDNVITAITVSLVNRSMSKSFYVKGDKPTDEMVKEIRKARRGTLMYIRLDIKNGKKAKSVWTRFTLDS